LASGGGANIGTPGIIPLTSTPGIVNASATQKRRRMSASMLRAMSGVAGEPGVIAEWSCGIPGIAS
jgi:hypothetical protein